MNSNTTYIFIIITIALLNGAINVFVPSKRKLTAQISAIVIGLLFMFSGFVKAVDPLGSAYKIHDYLEAFNLSWLLSSSTIMAVLLNIAEFFIGFAILFRIRVPIFAWGAFLFMVFFTPLTLYLALKNPVSDCGCFGDFIVLSNWDTFFKNIGFLLFSITLFINRKVVNPLFTSKSLQIGTALIGLSFALIIQVYALRYDAIFDFRPWKVGNKIADYVVPTMEKAEIMLVYKNNQTNKEELFTAENLPWEDSIRMANLTFVEQRKTIIQPFKEAPIHDFIIANREGDVLTEEIIANSNYIFMVVAYDLSSTNIESFALLNQFAQACEKDSILMVLLTGSTYNEIDVFAKQVALKFPVYIVDPIALKTVIRSNPGTLLLRDGYVMDKWAFRKMISYNEFKLLKESYQNKYQNIKK
jgi:hypothetical protein